MWFRALTFSNNGVFYRNSPNGIREVVDDYWSRHPGGCTFLFCDGSVRFVKESVNPSIFSYLSARAGGEVVSSDQF
jgi:prepilin-type processing-associated H-X9-DG protein